jgi:hypothetical protein
MASEGILIYVDIAMGGDGLKPLYIGCSYDYSGV